MTPLFPEVSADLARAADRPSRSRRLRAASIFGGGLSVLAVAGVATAATGVWNPQIGDERRGSPAISTTAVPKEQTDLLAVLGRPATAADRDSDVQGVLKLIGSDYSGVRTDAVRRLRTASETAAAPILIPTANASGIKDALCLHVGGPESGSGSSCFSTATVRDGKALLTIAGATAGNSTSVADDEARTAARQFATIDYYGLVPNGVASVSRSADGTTLTAKVRENLFHIRVADASMVRSTITWRAADGNVIKTTPGP